MKRWFIVVLILTLVCAGQSYADARIGIKGGVHLGNASIDVSPEPETSMRLGSVHGPYLEIIPMGGGLFAFRVEALWVDKGWMEDAVVAGRTVDRAVSIKELALAPFVLLYLGDAQFGTAPFLQVGPDIGFSMSNLSRTDTDPATFSENEDWAGLNFGLNFGGGVSFRAGMGKLVLDARYNLGLTSMNDAPAPFDADVVTNGIQFLVGYDFSVFPEYRRTTPGSRF